MQNASRLTQTSTRLMGLRYGENFGKRFYRSNTKGQIEDFKFIGALGFSVIFATGLYTSGKFVVEKAQSLYGRVTKQNDD